MQNRRIKNYNFYLLLLIILIVTGCGTLRVTHNPNITFSPNSRITVVSTGIDPLDVKGKLEHLLLSRGFNITSELTGSDKLKYESEIKGGVYSYDKSKASVQKSEASIERVREFRSKYILKFSYQRDLGLLVAGFSASLIDLDTGDIIIAANFSSGSRRIELVLEEFVNQLEQIMKKT